MKKSNDNCCSIVNTKRADETRRLALRVFSDKTLAENSLVMETVPWSDGFEPNNSRQNQGSAWTLLCSIGTPVDKHSTSVNTVPVALGPAMANHECVMQRFQEKLQTLGNNKNNCFHAGKLKKRARVLAVVSRFSQDRPERDSFACITGGKGEHAKRWRHSADCATIKDNKPFSCCDDCFCKSKTVVTENEGGGIEDDCDKCLQWEFSKTEHFCRLKTIQHRKVT